MSKHRIFAIILVALLVATVVIATKIYELNILSETPKTAVVRAGYQRFRKSTNGFSFKYPIGWKYESRVNLDHFISGNFTDQDGLWKFYLEAPYSAQEFVFTYRGAEAYFSPVPEGNLNKVVSVSSTRFLTNDKTTPVIFNIYKSCVNSNTSSLCIPNNDLLFATAVWQRGKASPVLSDRNESSQTGVLYSKFDPNDFDLTSKIYQFESIVKSLRFNENSDLSVDKVSRWLIYRNPDFKYSILYPSEFILKDNADLSYVYLKTGTEISFPTSSYEGTNLSEAKILIGEVEKEFVKENCIPDSGISNPADVIIINGIKFSRNVGAGAAAGNRYDTITYAFDKGGRCLNIVLFLHSSLIDNFPEDQRPVVFDKNLILNTFNEIIETFYIKS